MTRFSKQFAAIVLLAPCQGALASSVPQMDPTWYGNQLIWLFVSFLSLYALVAIFITPTIRKILAVRESAIDEAIREAEKAKSTAESTRGQSESAWAAAREKAATLTSQAGAAAARELNEQTARLDHDLERKLTQADARIEEARAKALKTVNAATAELAAAMAGKLLGRDFSEAEAENIVKQLAS